VTKKQVRAWYKEHKRLHEKTLEEGDPNGRIFAWYCIIDFCREHVEDFSYPDDMTAIERVLMVLNRKVKK
jgi:hypothetical protein